MEAPEDEEKMRRGKEVEIRMNLAWKEPNERALSINTLSAIESQSQQITGRHSGWAKIEDCVASCQTLSADAGYFSFTNTNARTMIERCLELELVDTKHCDDVNGIQQYIKVSPVYSDYKAYRLSFAANNRSPDMIFLSCEEGWWTKDCHGNYPPGGPSAKEAERFAPILERFHKGKLVKDRLDRAGGLTVGRFESMTGFMIALQMLEEQNPSRPGFPRYVIQRSVDGMVAMQAQRYQSPTEMDSMIAYALKHGLLSKVPARPGGPATLFKSTNDYFDLGLYVGGACNFKELLMIAGHDSRFTELFKNVGRT